MCLLLLATSLVLVDADEEEPTTSIPVTPPSTPIGWVVLPDTSVSNPTIHKYIEITINETIPGAKVYRLDRVTDMTGSTLHSDSAYPKWFRTSPRMIKFEDVWRMTSAANGIYYLRISAWNETESDNGVQVSDNSTVVDIHYDHSYDNIKWNFDYNVIGPGEVKMSITPTDAILGQQTEIYAWFEYQPIMSGGNPVFNSKGHPTFEYIGQQSKTIDPEFHISLPEPGVRYFGLYGSYNGDYQNTNTPTLDTGTGGGRGPNRNGSFQPVAIVTPYDNGTIPARVAGYTGINVTTPVLSGNYRFSTLKYNITIIDGGKYYARLGGAKPEFCEVEVPQDWDIMDNTATNTGFIVENVSSQVTDGSLAPGYIRLRLNKTFYHSTGWWWSYGEGNVPMIFDYPDMKWNGKQTDIRLRLYDELVNFSKTDNWQTITVRCTPLPEGIRLPERLSTGITWGGTDWLRDLSMDNRSAFFSMYKQLGFNTIPRVGLHYKHSVNDIPDLYPPSDRTDPVWDGLMYGPEHSSFYRGYNDGYGYYEMLKGKGKNYIDSKDLTNYGVSAANYSHERQKWMDSLDFYDNQTSGVVDIAYRGVWFNRSVQHLTEFVAALQPEIMFLDSESWSSFNGYKNNVAKSVAANSRRLPGETDYDLAYRMTDEFWRFLDENLSAACPTTKIALYGCTSQYDSGYQAFPWSILERYDVVCQPSVYAIMKHKEHLANKIRINKEHMPDDFDLIPWLSSGTYGEHDPELLIDITAHTFCNGATGLSFFKIQDVDDYDDILNIAHVIGYVSPYEDIIMDGDLAYMNFTSHANSVVSAMGHNGSYLMAVSPEDPLTPVTFTFTPANVSEHYSLYDIRHDKYYNFTPGEVVDFNDILDDCGVFILQPYTPVFPNPNLPPFMLYPYPNNNATGLPRNTMLAIQAFDNDTDLMNVTFYTNASGEWEQIGFHGQVTNGSYNIFPTVFTGYNTTYWWSVNVSDGKLSVNETFNFRTVESNVVEIFDEYPLHRSENVSVNLTTLTINISDFEGDAFDWEITTFPDVGSNFGLNGTNGTYSCTVSGLKYNTTYNWSVRAIDPLGANVMMEFNYWFRTEWEPVVVNETNQTNDTPPPVNLPPVAMMNGPFRAYRGDELTFDAAGSYDPEAISIDYHWDFGDGNTSTGLIVGHSYSMLGNFTVTLAVTDDLGLNATASTWVLIENYAPSLLVGETVTEIQIPLMASITVTPSDPEDDWPLVIHVKWGDEEIGSWTRNDTHTMVYGHSYSQPGIYVVEYWVVDGHGAVSEVQTHNVTVYPEDEPDPPPDPPIVDGGDGGNDFLAAFACWVGLIIALIVVIIIIIVVVMVIFMKKKSSEEEEEAPPPDEETADEPEAPTEPPEETPWETEETGSDPLMEGEQETLEDSLDEEDDSDDFLEDDWDDDVTDSDDVDEMLGEEWAEEPEDIAEDLDELDWEGMDFD